MIIATAGHVDHGKTRLVHVLTGVDTDRLAEEQSRGLTIDLGFAYVDMGNERVGFIDVPGHIRFIANMLAGVSIVDLALLVVAADDGIMPQTREHLAILDLLGIDKAIVALTKIDRADPDRIASVTRDIDSLLANTRLAGSAVIPVCSMTGEGLDALRTTIVDQAPTVMGREHDKQFRLAIDRCFGVKGAGTVVTGSVWSGAINVGDGCYLLPQGAAARVRGIHRQNQPSSSAVAGDRCALNIAGPDIDQGHIQRGNWIAASRPAATQRIDTYLHVLADGHPLKHWQPAHLHTAANHVTTRIALLDAKQIEPGASGLAQLVLSEPINVWHGDRLILRTQDAGTTLAGGHVIDPLSPARGRARPTRLAALKARLLPTARERLYASINALSQGLDLNAFALAENMTIEESREMATSIGAILIDNSWTISRDSASALAKQVLSVVEQRQQANATVTNESQLAQAGVPTLVLHFIIQGLVAERRLEQTPAGFVMPGYRAALEGPEAKLWEKVEPILKEEPLKPPVMHELAKAVGLPPKALEKLLVRCVHLGYVVRPVPNRFFLPAAITQLREAAIKVAAQNRGAFTVQDFRNDTGIGRNLTIEILEYFDRTGVTRRKGDTRTIIERQ